MTSELTAGEFILLPVEVRDGAFPEEKMISFEAMEGDISGFIRSEYILKQNGGSYIKAEVLGVEADRVAVKLHGSFFTTTGLAYISRNASEFMKAA